MEESGAMADLHKEPKLPSSDELPRPRGTEAAQRSTDIDSGRPVPKKVAKVKNQARGKVRGKHRKSKKSKKSTKAAEISDESSSDKENDSDDSLISSEDESDSDSSSTSEDEAGVNTARKSRRGKRSAAVRATKSKSKAKKARSKSQKNAETSDSNESSSSSSSVASSYDRRRRGSDANLGNDDMKEQLQALKAQLSTLQQYIAQRTPQTGAHQQTFGQQALQPTILQQFPQPSIPTLSLGYQPIQAALSQPSPVLPPSANTVAPTLPAPNLVPGHQAKNIEEELLASAQNPGVAIRRSKSKSAKNTLTKNNSKDTSDRPEFKRVDWVWDATHYNFKLQDTAETTTDAQYDDFVFHVRRTFDVNGKFRRVYVDIKSKLLRECLQDVIGTVQGVSLVDETPKLDPNLLFLYLDDFRTHLKALKELKPAGETKKERRKNQTRLDDKRKHLKVLIRYINSDYAKVKDSLHPMVKNGLITYDLLWALWKPGTLAYSTAYSSTELGRVFRVESADRHNTMAKGDFYYIDGKYFEFDGKKFGYGHVGEDVPEFRGARRITSLSCYPLSYCKDEAKIRESMIERGKKFVSLGGMHYKAYAGMAYMKRKKGVIRFNIQTSRIMVDPSTFRRMNPNYYVSPVKPEERVTMPMGDTSDDESNDDSGNSSDDGSDQASKYVSQVVKDPDGNVQIITIPKASIPTMGPSGKLDEISGKNVDNATESTETDKTPGEDEPANLVFTDDDYLIASPVVLGFCFSEKQWLEFEITCVNDIKWNDQAWDSLVLEDKTKDLIKALVVSRKYSAANTIDDVIHGKGKGLVTVLHGPPGTGKTLTAEGISEMLKCPLYMASAGELGTDSRYLEHELQKILDICHAWGAILLLDEADVFLEKRNMQDIHRNALVSIFLRQLEYFQGILFLTTNRVETFDEAFQSRIHIALRYDKLDSKAKKAIFKMFIERVRAHGKLELKPFRDEELNELASHDLNGREIKNILGSAQDLAVSKNEPLSLVHVRQVLGVHDKFGRDLKGGSGYEEAMRSYC